MHRCPHEQRHRSTKQEGEKRLLVQSLRRGDKREKTNPGIQT